jgi:hypothetical protein
MEGLNLRWRGEIRSGLGKSQADIRLSSNINEETNRNVQEELKSQAPGSAQYVQKTRYKYVCRQFGSE